MPKDNRKGGPVSCRVPSDCVVSNTQKENRYALRQMKKIVKANVSPSIKLRLGRLL